MKLRILLTFALFVSSVAFSQDISNISLNLTNDGIFFGTDKIPDSVKIDYFINKLGQPNRTQHDKGFDTDVYDNLGITITYRKKSKDVTSINYFFKSLIHSDKKNFSG